MTKSTEPRNENTARPDPAGKPATSRPGRPQGYPQSDDQYMTDAVQENVKKGKLSSTEARKVYEDVGKQLDA